MPGPSHVVTGAQVVFESLQSSSHWPVPSCCPLELETSAAIFRSSPTRTSFELGISEMVSFLVGGGVVVVALRPPVVCCTTHQEMPPATTSTLTTASGFWREPGIDGNLTGPASIPLPTIAANTPTTPNKTSRPAT